MSLDKLPDHPDFPEFLWVPLLQPWGPAHPGSLKAKRETRVRGGARQQELSGAPASPSPLLPPRPSRLQPCPLAPSPLASSSWASTGLRVTDDTLPGAWLRSPQECSQPGQSGSAGRKVTYPGGTGRSEEGATSSWGWGGEQGAEKLDFGRDGSQQGPSDLQAPPRLVKYPGPVHSPSLTPEHPVMQRSFQL